MTHSSSRAFAPCCALECPYSLCESGRGCVHPDMHDGRMRLADKNLHVSEAQRASMVSWLCLAWSSACLRSHGALQSLQDGAGRALSWGLGECAGGDVPQQKRRHVRTRVPHLPLRLEWCDPRRLAHSICTTLTDVCTTLTRHSVPTSLSLLLIIWCIDSARGSWNVLQACRVSASPASSRSWVTPPAADFHAAFSIEAPLLMKLATACYIHACPPTHFGKPSDGLLGPCGLSKQT